MPPDGWRFYPIGELTENLDSMRIPVKELNRRPGAHPYYGASGIVDYVDGYLFDGEHLLVAEDGENLRSRQTPIAFIANGKFWVNNHAHVLRGNALALTRFLVYALQNGDFRPYLTGSTLPKLTQGNLNQIPILTPPLPEQARIVHVLRALDDKIELNRCMNETIETIACTIFKAWFVTFDPVKDKKAGRIPSLRSETANLFPTSLQDSQAGMIPAGWTTAPILAIADLLSGGTPKTDRKDYWGGTILWASAKDVSQCGDAFLCITERTITDKGLAESATQIIPALATLIVARGATTGRMVISAEDMAMNQTCYALVSKVKAPFTLYCHLKHEMEQLLRGAHGSVFDTITTSSFQNVRVVIPPKLLVEAFERLISPLFLTLRSNVLQNITLEMLRNALLPKLLSGKLRIKEAEKIVEAYA
jgi:type I restriction enzyme S subunit